MEKKNTKQIILEQALELFSNKGFEAVSVQDIALAVGIKAPSLYKHYESKQAIYDAILLEMDRRYHEQTKSLQITGIDPIVDSKHFNDINVESLVQMGENLFLYFVHDEYVKKFRKMLTVEQYLNKRHAEFFSEQYFDGPIKYQESLFKMLLEMNHIHDVDAHIMALHFYTPLFALITLCDRQPAREEETLELVKNHIRQFSDIYFRVTKK